MQVEAPADPRLAPLLRVRGKVEFDGMKRVSTQTLSDALEVPQRGRNRFRGDEVDALAHSCCSASTGDANAGAPLIFRMGGEGELRSYCFLVKAFVPAPRRARREAILR